jgi:type IV conjugative transfer system coupling protein TraD
MSNFLRGGQVTAHKVRMLIQVVKIIIKLSFLALIISLIYSLSANISIKEWRLIPAIIKSYIWHDIDSRSYVSYYDELRVSTISNFLRSSSFGIFEQKFTSAISDFKSKAIIVLFIAQAVVIIFFWLRGKQIKLSNYLRGSFLISEKELRHNIVKYNKQFKGLTSYKLANIPFPATGKGKNYTPGEQAHSLILGATGAGKTRVIQDLVAQLEKHQQKAIIVDIKGDYISYFYNAKRGDVILNPLDKRGANWSFFKEASLLTGFETIAKTLITDNSKEQFWSNAARRIFCEMAKLYWFDGLSLSEFTDKVLNQDLAQLEKILANTSAKHLVDSKADRTVVCVLMMLAVHLSPLKLYTKTNDIFSIKDWIQDNLQNNFLFISTSSQVKESLNPLVQMQIDIAINSLCSARQSLEQKTVWFILDELPYFDKPIISLKDGLATSRSFGGAFVLGSQDMSSLSKIYGHDLSRVIANNCRNKLIMNIDDSYTAKWCSDLLGEAEVEEWNEGLSYGAHEVRDGISAGRHKSITQAVLASEFSKLRVGESYIKMPGFQPALINFNAKDISPKSNGFEPNQELIELLRVSVEDAVRKRQIFENIIASDKKSPESSKEIDKKLEDLTYF